MPHIDHIIALSDEWLRVTGLKQTTLSSRLFDESKKLSILRGTGDLSTARYRAAVLWFSANWPDGAIWPDDLARPVPA